jgi:transketolase C-terminal domain/subunit
VAHGLVASHEVHAGRRNETIDGIAQGLKPELNHVAGRIRHPEQLIHSALLGLVTNQMIGFNAGLVETSKKVVPLRPTAHFPSHSYDRIIARVQYDPSHPVVHPKRV